MPLPQALEPLLVTEPFWRDAYWLSTYPDSYAELDGCSVDFELTDRHVLHLEIACGLGMFTLSLSAGGEAPVEIAWDDDAQFHPHVLRWKELDAIGRAVASRDPVLAHPGVPVLLLARFAPVTNDEDAGVATALLDAAWDRLGLFSRQERLEFFRRLDARGSRFEWRETARGHALGQPDDVKLERGLYTLRHEENGDFPFQALEEIAALFSARGSHNPPG